MIADKGRQAARSLACGKRGLLALPAALTLASCATTPPPPAAPPPLETITVPLPENIIAAPPAPQLPSVPITQSQGEDLWHLRSGLNVAALICDAATFPQLIPGYNAMLRTHKALLTTAANTEIAQFRANGGKWEGRYDTHITKIYNQYSLTGHRDRFCTAAGVIVDDAADLTSEVLATRATEFLARMDLAATAP